MDSLLKKYHIYPIILCIFPVVFLVVYNLDKVSILSQISAVILPVIGILLVWALMRRLIKDVHKADLVTSVIGVMFFTYGHLLRSISILLIWTNGSSFDVLEKFGRMYDHPEVLRMILAGWTGFVFITVFLLVKTRINLATMSFFLNYISLAIVALVLVNIGYITLSDHKSKEYVWEWTKQFQVDSSTKLICPENLPDIYYIIPDGYARQDVLQDIYSFDNSGFVDFLTSQGFIVVEQSLSNYAQTPLSIASSLNFTYLDQVLYHVGQNSESRAPLQEMIVSNRISTLLHRCGYTIITFSTGFEPTEIRNADIYLSPDRKISDFQNEIINLTPLPTISLALSLINQYQLHRDRILFTLDELPDLGSRYSSPIFVFAHITAPHHPFVFDAVGNPQDSGRLFALSEDFKGTGVQEYMRGYIGQLSYLNSRLAEVIPEIISHKPDATIILLQSDHGPSSQLDWNDPSEPGIFERMAILNAYYLPARDLSALPDNITPVNSFRFILNHYFGTGFSLLENRSYFSTLNSPYQMKQVDYSTIP